MTYLFKSGADVVLRALVETLRGRHASLGVLLAAATEALGLGCWAIGLDNKSLNMLMNFWKSQSGTAPSEALALTN